MLLKENIIFKKSIKYNILKYLIKIIILSNFLFIYFVLNIERNSNRFIYSFLFYTFTLFFFISLQTFLFFVDYKFLGKDLNWIKLNYSLERKNNFSMLFFAVPYLFFLITKFKSFIIFEKSLIFSIVSVIFFLIIIWKLFKIIKDLSSCYEESEDIAERKIQYIETNKKSIYINNIERSKTTMITNIISILIYITSYIFLSIVLFDLTKIAPGSYQIIFSFIIFCAIHIFTFIYGLFHIFKYRKEKII